jgi:hypothetical protein
MRNSYRSRAPRQQRPSRPPRVEHEQGPAPAPATWRVEASDGALEVTAVYATVSTQGALVFKNAEGQLIEGFAFGSWRTVKMIGKATAATIGRLRTLAGVEGEA